MRASGAVTPAQVVVLAANGRVGASIARGPVGGFEATRPRRARPVKCKSGSATVHGLLWRPRRRGRRAPAASCMVHGGPTGQALADWNARVQWLVQRGYAVLQPNYRGSSGYGRAYTQALAGVGASATSPTSPPASGTP